MKKTANKAKKRSGPLTYSEVKRALKRVGACRPKADEFLAEVKKSGFNKAYKAFIAIAFSGSGFWCSMDIKIVVDNIVYDICRYDDVSLRYVKTEDRLYDGDRGPNAFRSAFPASRVTRLVREMLSKKAPQ